MADALPDICTLSPADLTTRLAEIAAIGEDALLDAQLDGPRARLRFRPDAGVRARLERLVAAEASCCSFLEMRVGEDGDALELTIVAPARAEAALAQLVAQSGPARS